MTGTREVAAAAPMTDRRRWLVMSVVLIGTLMVALDTTIVNIALPRIRDDLGVGAGIEWVVTAYLLAVAASQPAMGWLADRFGRRRIFLLSLTWFTVASFLAALSPNLATLVVLRVVQGFGGGALTPVGMAIVVELFPVERRGRAMSLWGIASMAAPAIGPTLGGWLVTAVSWHWLFLINVPMGAGGLILGLRLLPDSGYRERRSFDALGSVLASGGLTVTLYAVTQADRWGWGSTRFVSLFGTGLALLVAFVLQERRCPEPMIDLAIFRSSVFSLGMTITLFITAAQYARLVFVPLALETLRGYTPFRVGLMLFPPAIATMVGMSIGGRLVDRIGPRLPVLTGAASMFTAAALLGNVTVHTNPAVIIGSLAIQGIGFGMCAMPATVSAMNSVPARWVAQASAIRTLNSQVSGAVAISVLSAVVAARMGDNPTVTQQQDAYNTAFYVVAGGLVVAGVCAWFLPRRAMRGATADEALLLGE